MQALSQLSYGPMVPSKCSREVEIVGPIDASFLVVTARLQTKRDRGTVLDDLDRDQEASVELEVVGTDRINFLRGVATANEPLSTAPCALATHDYVVASARSPLALDPKELR